MPCRDEDWSEALARDILINLFIVLLIVGVTVVVLLTRPHAPPSAKPTPPKWTLTDTTPIQIKFRYLPSTHVIELDCVNHDYTLTDVTDNKMLWHGHILQPAGKPCEE